MSLPAAENEYESLTIDDLYARSEAITRGTTVTVTGLSGTDWKQGYTITEAAGGTTLRQTQARSSQIQFTASQNAVSFDRSGRATNAAAVNFFIAPSTDYDAHAVQDYQRRCVKLDPSGRPRSIEGVCT